ncbi:50S ribosomal protein L3 [Rickettsia endosymbiont of Cardiosporidium cionae]|uniref:50S ribosomal protein L3 n=1 Tax=Rickettsia endosymbiont of Cardiosporidium cionae TaxID=2777155 RepID=UPI0018951578|nr:50S ribosomal protein L3 [Rickettsia endosymbiont of Cardiosporidium cionae]KAF8818202.1 50S ribosomal protein L3 [Rickettsia endosymbiont of Cardiosporidium cionae]
MRSGLIAKKIGMSSVFTKDHSMICVTFLQIDSCVVAAHRTVSVNGYNALVIASTIVDSNKLSKPLQSFFSTLRIQSRTKIKEFPVSEDCMINVGVELNADYFSEGQFLDVSAYSIGKGFAGGIKRHGFSGLEATHGVSVSHRSHGSTGGCQDPGKVFKNKKMAGHMGCKMVTKQNLKVVSINSDKNVIVIKGSVPGAKNSYVYLKDAVKKIVVIK